MARLTNQNMKPGLPVKPKRLRDVASGEWDRLIARLTESDIKISTAHGFLIEQAATIVEDMMECRKAVADDGTYLVNEKTGVTQIHPAARRLDGLRRDYVKVLSLLGLRSAVGGGGQEGQSMDDILDGK